MEMQASLRAENIEESHGLDAALKWHKAAATTSETLTELQGKLLTAVDYKASTKDGHRKALRELLAYLKNPEAAPKDVTLSVANVFIDQWITQQGYAYNTIGDRLACLSVL